MKLKQKKFVRPVRSRLPIEYFSHLPNFIFWNPGSVMEKSGERVRVKWSGGLKYWFDADVLRWEA